MKNFSEKQASQIVNELEKSGLNFKEVMAECKRIASRAADTIRFGSARILKETREIRVGSKNIPLSAKEFGIFNMLYLNAGSPVTRAQISAEVWGHDADDSKNHSIDVCVNHLRKKVLEAELPVILKTVIGQGYMLETADSKAAAETAPEVAAEEPAAVVEPA